MGYITAAILAISLCCAVSARADQLMRKGGEWHSTVTGITPQPQTMDMCFSETTFDQAMAKMAEGKQCSKRDIKISGNLVTIDLVCGAMSMKGTATLSGDTAYTADLTMQVNGGPVMHTVTESKWIGACKPGQKPMG
jgi:hypothetical protein